LSVLRPLLINPLLVLGVAAVGAVSCRWTGADWHGRELAVAAAVSLLAAEAAVTMIALQHGASTVHLVQTSLMALGLHLLLSLVLAAAAMLSGRVGPAFAWWMLAMFWATLLGVCAVLVRAIRHGAGSPPGTVGNGSPGTSAR
jgi:hypothetical protein